MGDRILRIDSSARTEAAVTRDLAGQIITRLGPEMTVTTRDLARAPVPQIDIAWIDLVPRAGVTIQYTGNGSKGLLEGRRAILAVASDGTKTGSAIDFATGNMRQVLGFIGIGQAEIVAEGRITLDTEGPCRCHAENRNVRLPLKSLWRT